MSNDQKEQTTFRVTDRRGMVKEEVKEDFKKEEPRKAEPKSRSTGQSPRIDFTNFILSLSSSALMHMGLLEEPEGEAMPKNIPAAKQEIDMIEMLKEKTKGNLTPQEEKLMEQVLYELHVRFVEASRP